MARRRTVKYSLPQFDYDPKTQYVDFKDPVETYDFDFVSNTFIPDVDFFGEEDEYKDWVFRTNADNEFMNTSFGGHLAINMPYAFTTCADLPRKGRALRRDRFIDDRFSNDLGAGRYYAETIMKFSEPRVLIMEAGVPEHRSAFAFFSEAISFRESVIAKEGRSPFMFEVGKIIGTGGAILAFPIAAPLIYLSQFIVGAMFGNADPRYYTFKPSMHNYVLSANSIFKNLLIERGLLRLSTDKSDVKLSRDEYGAKFTIDKDFMADLKIAIPEIINKDGEIDLFRVVARPQLIASEMVRRERNMMGGNPDLAEQATPPNNDINMKSYLERVFKLNSFKSTMNENGEEENEKQEVPNASININPSDYNKTSRATGAKKRLPHDKTQLHKDDVGYVEVIRDMGFESVAFYVDYVGTSTYSFTNEIKDIPAKSMVNAIGGASRDAKFSLANSKLFGDTIEGVVKGARDVVMGTIESASFGLSSVITSLLGGGYISFPKMWSDSSISLPNHTFKITLGGPYGNDISRAMDIDAPLSLILAMVLPIGVGRASYTSPFLARAFLRGIVDIDFGMVTNLSISMATGVLGRTQNGAPLQIEVSFTVTDFSDIVAPRMPNAVLGAYNIQLDDASPLHRFSRTLAGRGYRTSRYKMKNFKYRLSAIKSDLGTFLDAGYIASMASDTMVSELFKIGNIDNKTTSLFSN